MRRILLDTSVFIAEEQRDAVVPEAFGEVAVSVITLGELETGVLMARDDATRAHRLATLVGARERAVGLDVDQEVASAYARLLSEARRAGRRPRANDAWIAATATAHEVPLLTEDRDFDAFESVEVIQV